MKNGKEVQDLKELQENFDMTQLMMYYSKGELEQWLRGLYYEDEADAVVALDADSQNIRKELCNALGITYHPEEGLTEEEQKRLEEKKRILAEKGADEAILSVAARIALTQKDLASLLNKRVETIYLCGAEFSIPLSVENVKYIGVLGTSKIRMKAKSEAELQGKNISFENVILPWENMPKPSESSVQSAETDAETRDPLKEELLELFEMCFGFQPKNLWYNENNNSTTDISEKKKKLLLKYLCNNELQENEFIYIHFKDDFSIAYGLSKNGIHITVPEHGRDECCYKNLDTKYSYSNDIEETITDMLREITSDDYDDYTDFVMQEELYRFLNMAKNL